MPHDDQWLRIGLELLILGCLFVSVRALKRDWNLLRPPYWRIIVTALLLVVFSHAAATVLLLSGGYDITPGTWIGLGAYGLVAVVLTYAQRLANRYHRP